MDTVIGLFETEQSARLALQSLKADGFVNEKTGLLARKQVNAADLQEETGQEIAEKAGVSALGGTLAGSLAGLLAGLGVISIPGIGPVVAAGALATILGATAAGAGLGAATGGLLGALIGLGISEERAEFYVQRVKHGAVLVLLEIRDDQVADVVKILKQSDVVDINTRHIE
jgi:uncharacterized membrane protein